MSDDTLQQRRPPTKAQLVALWRTRLVELRRVIGRLEGIQQCIAERTGTHPWLPPLPDYNDIEAAIGDSLYLNNIPWLEPSADEVSRGTLLKAEIARSKKRIAAERIAAEQKLIEAATNVHRLSDHRSRQPEETGRETD